jgi:hypothetical protein
MKFNPGLLFCGISPAEEKKFFLQAAFINGFSAENISILIS